MEPSEPRRPSLTPSFVPSSKETSRIVTQVESPAPHLGWHSRGYLPHWDHPGMIQSLNFRLADAMPSSVVEKWRAELGLSSRFAPPCFLGAPASRRRDGVSRKHAGEDAGAPRDSASKEAVELRRRIEKYLDAGHGACWLRQSAIAGLVESALLHFDEQRYRLLAWCVMPNHIHALIEAKEGFPLNEVLHSWKSFTSHEANKLLGRQGELWQREYLDRYVRNAEHFEKVIAYIEENPVEAGLARLKIEWPWSSARFRAGRPGSTGVPPVCP